MDAPVSVSLGYACNNSCRHCPVPEGRRPGRRPLADVVAQLERARASGARAVALTGGEPTLHPRFLDVLRACGRLGFGRVVVRTNGRMFAYPGLARDAAQALAASYAVALQGPDATTHEGVTRARGSFSQTVRGMANLAAAGHEVTASITVTTLNLERLADTVALAAERGARGALLSPARPVGMARQDVAGLVPPLTRCRSPVLAAIDEGRRRGVEVLVEAVPFCVLGSRPRAVSEQYLAGSPTQALAELAQGREKDPHCALCRFDPICAGVWREYASLFGVRELHPVPRGGRRPEARARPAAPP